MRRIATALLVTAIAALLAPTLAQAANSWQEGPLEESLISDCNTHINGYEAGAFLAYYVDPANPPKVGDTYYVALNVASIGSSSCAGMYGDFNLALPSGTTPHVTSSTPVICYVKFPGSSTWVRDTGSECSQSPPASQYGYSFNPAGLDPPFWPLPRGTIVEVDVPVVSTQPLNGAGATKLQGVVPIYDGVNNPTLNPTLVMIVNPQSTPSTQRLGVDYPTPSVTSNAQQPNTSTSVGIVGYVWNYSNPGSVVAQVAYADAAGDCTNPGAPFYTTPPVSLQNPQTQITGSLTGLYADVAHCWRIKANVTSGSQAGEYDGNWQYFVTNGTYYTYANEPPMAKPFNNPQCSADGSGCTGSNCTNSSCGTCPAPCFTSKAKPTPTPDPILPGPVAQLAKVGALGMSKTAFAAASAGPSATTARKAKAKPKPTGTKVTFSLNQAASVRFTVTQGRPGRRAKGKRCVAPTRANRKAARCTRTVTLPGSFTRNGKAGSNSFHFTGRIGGRKLTPGSYKLVAVPTANGQAGAAGTRSFRIVG
jgi:hypothetical protein